MIMIPQPTYVTGRAVLSVFAFNIDWAYSVDIYALVAMAVRGVAGLSVSSGAFESHYVWYHTWGAVMERDVPVPRFYRLAGS